MRDVSEHAIAGVLDGRPDTALHPRFRELATLATLIEQRAPEFPDRVDDWRRLLARFAESAEDGVLPSRLDAVVRTIFYDLLYVGAAAPAAPGAPEPQLAPAPEPEPQLVAAPDAGGERREHVPFWKKELSLKRTPKPAQAPAEKPAAESVPFWKKELSLKRAPKPPQPVEAAPSAPPDVPARPELLVVPPAPAPEAEAPPVATAEEPRAAKTPFWKKELSLKREAKPVQAPQEQPAADRVPFWKKELSLKRAAKPVQAPQEEPAADRVPFWKKELSLKRAPKPAKAPKARASGSGLRRELTLPQLRLPSFRRGRAGGAHGAPAKVVGLRIGSSQLAAALVHNNGSAQLQQLARSPLQRGIVASGEVQDPEALAAALKRFFAQHKLPRRNVRLGVATNRIGVRVVEVPVVDDERQFANAIRFRAQEVVPIPLGEAVLDHVVLGESEDESGGKVRRVLLVFAHRELVDAYLGACRRAGLKLAGVDFDAFALLRAVSENGRGDEPTAAVVAVAIGHERTIFAVSEGSVCDFARVLEWGGSSLDAALARALDVSPEDAEAVKQTLSLEGPGGSALSPIQLEAARAALKQEVQVLARELVSSLQFYQSRPGSLDLGAILLTGGAAQLEGLAAELSRQMGVPVTNADPLAHVTFADGVERPASAASLAIAVGLGIEA
ncbi:MAG TPA: type IV pilus assembly protein PilM [Gaiellaceae bacterium]|nr:type IV pilus assembly protein PilM [Gaiellaceae bacterium]